MNNDNTDYVSNESGTLSRLFKLPQHGTTVRTELIAGMTTFLTMVYIVFVNPQILGAAQMDPKVVFVTTCLIAGIGSIAIVRYFRVFYYNCVVITSFSCRGACFYCGDVLLWIIFR